MNISLKSVKIADHLSQETNAFTATLYVDGKRTARIRNGGTGGCDEYDTFNMPLGARERLADAERAAAAASGSKFEPLAGFVEALMCRADPHMVKWAERMHAAGCTHLYDDGDRAWSATRGPACPGALPIDHFSTSPSLTLDRSTAEALDLT